MPFVNFALVSDRLLVTTTIGPNPVWLGGLPHDPSSQALVVDDIGVIASWANGIPLTAGGAIAVSLANGAVGFYNRGLAFNLFGQLQMTETFLVRNYVAGWPVDIDGRVCIVGSGPPPPAPGAFTFLVPVVASDNVLLSWSTSVNATSYQVKRDGVLIHTAALGELDWTDVGRPNGTYVYSVIANNGGGNTPSTPATQTAVVAVSTSNFRVTAIGDFRTTATGDSRITV